MKVNDGLKTIYCVECCEEVDCSVVTGQDVYPHRRDLYKKKFWQCPNCNNFVGTHKHSGLPTGVIANRRLKSLRIKIHSIIDPLWRSGRIGRKELYEMMSDALGYEYHTAEIRSEKEAFHVIEVCNCVKECLHVQNKSN